MATDTSAQQVPWYEEIALPVLFAEARKVYGEAIHAALAAAGIDDMPPTGARVVGGIRRMGNLRDAALQLGIAKQAASQVIDTLALRGYVQRLPDESDGRRIQIALTPRGEVAAQIVNEAVEAVNRTFEEKIGAEEIRHLRLALGRLVELGHPSPVSD